MIWAFACGEILSDWYLEVVPGGVEELQETLWSESLDSPATWLNYWRGFTKWATSRAITVPAHTSNQDSASDSRPTSELNQYPTISGTGPLGINNTVTFSMTAAPLTPASTNVQYPTIQANPETSYVLLCFQEGLLGHRLHH